MVIDERSGRVTNLGCPEGVNWWVRHDAGRVHLEFPDGRQVSVTATDWRLAVTAFSAQVWAYFAASPPKQAYDEWDAQWFAAFMQEWAARGGYAHPDVA